MGHVANPNNTKLLKGILNSRVKVLRCKCKKRWDVQKFYRRISGEIK
jgi:hypothetical protein